MSVPVVDPAHPDPEPVPVETPEQRRTRELEASLAVEAAYVPPATQEGRPLPDGELTPEQLRIRQLEDQLAKAQARRFSTANEEFEAPTAGDHVILHFVEDGFTALGRVWYRGQEIDFVVGETAYEDTRDRSGVTWVSLAGDDAAQYEKFGRVMYRAGPWPGKDWEDDVAKRAESSRARRPPLVPLR